MSQKKYYMDVVNILSPINIFAGGLTIATQFITPCSEPSLANLLALASELFLASLAGLVVVFLLLYGFWDSDIISNGPKPVRIFGRDWGRHSLVVAQVIIVGIIMIAAFVVLSVAIVLVGNHWARGLGMGLVFLVFIGAILVGIMIGRNKFVRVAGALAGPPDPVPIHDVERDFTKKQTIAILCFLMLEVIMMLAILGIGIWQAIRSPETGCDSSILPVQWPPYTLAVSEADNQTNFLATFTDMDAIIILTLTETNTIITRSWSHRTEIPTSVTTTTASTEVDFSTTISFSIIRTILIKTDNSPSIVSSAITTTTPTSLPPGVSEISTPSTYEPVVVYQTSVTSTYIITVPCTATGLVDGEY